MIRKLTAFALYIKLRVENKNNGIIVTFLFESQLYLSLYLYFPTSRSVPISLSANRPIFFDLIYTYNTFYWIFSSIILKYRLYYYHWIMSLSVSERFFRIESILRKIPLPYNYYNERRVLKFRLIYFFLSLDLT